MLFLAKIYAVPYIYHRFQPVWNHTKAFHGLKCQNVGYIMDIGGILEILKSFCLKVYESVPK